MFLNRLNIITAIFSLMFCTFVNAETNKALEAWKKYAASSGNPNHQKWVDEISKPEAIELAKKWKELRGYDAYDIIEKANLPAELKPGLKITKENVGQFPWLKDYMPAELIDHLSSDWSNIAEITIVPTNTYYPHKGYYEGTKELQDKGIELQYTEAGELVYPDGSFALMSGPGAQAIPFLDPKNGMELNWNYIAQSVNVDTVDFEPVHMRACTPNGKVDSDIKADLFWWDYHGRMGGDGGPTGSIEGKEDYLEGGSIFFLEPNDIRGLSGVRQRYPQADKEDDFKVFIPSLRRTRTLTGSDAQDPIASGQELTWDDWHAYWGKTDTDAFEYKKVGETFILASPEVGYVYDSAVLTDDQCNYKSMELELRPVWIFEITDKTGKYMYSKRTTWLDKEFYYMQYHITEDPRGNKFRNWDDSRAWRPSVGDAQWRFVMVNNYVTKRMSTLYMNSLWEGRGERVTEEMFDIDMLRDYK